MSNSKTIKCPICFATIPSETDIIEKCPACNEEIAERLEQIKNQNEGLTTARTKGTNLKPASDLNQDVY